MKMKLVFRSLGLLLCSALLVLTMSSCYAVGWLFYEVYGPVKYEGPHMDLYTVAVNNVFGVYGVESNGEVSWGAQTTVLEEDSYGRVLFLYDEHNDGFCAFCGNDDDCYGLAYCILQKSDGAYAWFYQDNCYMFATQGEEKPDLNPLKLRNDWDQPLNMDRCTKAPYVDEKPNAPGQVPESVFEEAMKKYLKRQSFGGYSLVSSVEYSNTDMAGNELYYVQCRTGKMYDGRTIYKDYAVIVRADGTIDQSGISQVVSRKQAWDTVMELKIRNNWVYPQ